MNPSGCVITCACGWEEFCFSYTRAINLWEAHLARGECAFHNASKGIAGVTKNLFEEGYDDMAKRVMQGSTEDASAPILGAKFWKEGKEITGEVYAKFDTENGLCYNVKLAQPITVDGSILKPQQDGNVKLDRISIGSMKGLEMAIRSCGTDHLETGDLIRLKCTGETATDKGNPMVNFKIRIERESADSSDAF